MARSGFDDLQIKVTTVSSTGAFRDISQQVIDFSGWQPEAILELSHTAGDAWEESLPVGLNRLAPITIGGHFDDDSSTGTAGIFGLASDLGAERVLRVNFLATTGATGAPTNFKVDVIVQSYKRLPSRGALTRFELMLQPTGAYSVVTTT